MAIVDDLNKIREWLQAEVCDKIKLKMPKDEKNDGGYAYELVNPAAFVLFTPTKDRLPPNVKAPIPSICIRFTEGVHNPREGVNKMGLMLNFCTWNPGTHRQDNFIPKEEGAGIKGYNVSATAEYKRNSEGWQDVYNFIDFTLRKLEKSEFVADMRIVAEEGIKYGMTWVKDGLDDFYPYWLGWISFSVQAGNVRTRSFDDFL